MSVPRLFVSTRLGWAAYVVANAADLAAYQAAPVSWQVKELNPVVNAFGSGFWVVLGVKLAGTVGLLCGFWALRQVGGLERGDRAANVMLFIVAAACVLGAYSELTGGV